MDASTNVIQITIAVRKSIVLVSNVQEVARSVEKEPIAFEYKITKLFANALKVISEVPIPNAELNVIVMEIVLLSNQLASM